MRSMDEETVSEDFRGTVSSGRPGFLSEVWGEGNILKEDFRDFAGQRLRTPGGAVETLRSWGGVEEET